MTVTSFRARAVGRVRRDIDSRRPDAEIRQMRALLTAYNKADAPEILLIGDSALSWTSPHDADRRTLAQMIGAETHADLRIHALAGPGYNPRIANVFIEALSTSRFRPRVVVLPSSHLMATTAWSTHPRYSYASEAAELRRIALEGDHSTRRLPRASQRDWQEWDRQPIPSLRGMKWTVGEARMITNALHAAPKWMDPVTPWQQAVRMRHLMDYYNAEQLTPESTGVQLLTAMAGLVTEMGQPALTYIPPLNHEVLVRTLGPGAEAHVLANSAVLRSAFEGPQPTDDRLVIDATFETGASGFGDPIHLNHIGRLALARRISDGIARLQGER